MTEFITRHWYSDRVNLWLVPLSWLFGLLSIIRRWLYRIGVKKTTQLPVPIIVVGNITVGGTGKTPLVMWLAQKLMQQGCKVGVVSRGYGAQHAKHPLRVTKEHMAHQVGDEPLLMASNLSCPVVICPDRVAAVRFLLKHQACDVVISDDGLQHYALGRSLEIAVIDGQRGFGNRRYLPAGPLREPLSRLQEVDYIVSNGRLIVDYAKSTLPFAHQTMTLVPRMLRSVMDLTRQLDWATFSHRKIHAVAGIGNPSRFFHTLEELGLSIIPHAFPDHHVYQAAHIDFGPDVVVVMTEKDAVKCRQIADDRHWFLPVEVTIDEPLDKQVCSALQLPCCAHHESE